MNETLLLVALTVAVAGLVLLGIKARSLSRSPAPAPQPLVTPSPLEALGGGERILDHMEEGVVVIDAALQVRYANRSSRALLGLRSDNRGSRIPSPEIATVARTALDSGGPAEELVEAFYPSRRSLKVRAVPLEGAAALVMIQDVSEEVLTQKIRREFVSHASHELKSPVASLQALAEAMNEAIGASDHDSTQRFSGRILSELARMSKLVNDLLDLSR
ncbi:MAG: histidine kinase dimerization/phospho-acceptor domain-containing protein, partial [Actinomycetota bacterium]